MRKRIYRGISILLAATITVSSVEMQAVATEMPPISPIIEISEDSVRGDEKSESDEKKIEDIATNSDDANNQDQSEKQNGNLGENDADTDAADEELVTDEDGNADEEITQPEEAETDSNVDLDQLESDGGYEFATSYEGGSGTKEDPYQIKTKAQLLYFSYESDADDTYYELVADIDLNEDIENPLTNWGCSKTTIRNVLNGNNHTIRNVFMFSYNTNISMLGTSFWQIENLKVENLRIDCHVDSSNTRILGLFEKTTTANNCQILGDYKINIENDHDPSYNSNKYAISSMGYDLYASMVICGTE